ncbi:MAG: penicillin acylase family protein, partial [Candidatus Poribacteria bacterium]|nr:penicillin acylase family protein [Candidatus Poribacteria bacterium]
SHPLGVFQVMGRFLNMPRNPLPGSEGCVRSPRASVRMVVSPGHDLDGSLHMPCGQSGNPVSKNYKDQHDYWVRGEWLPFLPGSAAHTLKLTPNP